MGESSSFLPPILDFALFLSQSVQPYSPPPHSRKKVFSFEKRMRLARPLLCVLARRQRIFLLSSFSLCVSAFPYSFVLGECECSYFFLFFQRCSYSSKDTFFLVVNGMPVSFFFGRDEANNARLHVLDRGPLMRMDSSQMPDWRCSKEWRCNWRITTR